MTSEKESNSFGPRSEECALQAYLPAVVESMLSSYRSTPEINHIGSAHLPSRESIIRTLDALQKLLYPGFFGKQDLCEANIQYVVGQTIDELFVELSRQTAHSLIHAMPAAERTPETKRKTDRRAREIIMEFLRRLPELRQWLRDDVLAAYDGDPAAKGYDEIIFSYPGLVAITIYRIAHELLALAVPLLPRIMTEYAHTVTGIDIHPGAKIGRRFFIDHGTGVVIGETTDIGANVKIYQGVTLGALSFPKDATGQLIRGKKRHPTLEDDVVIYANATILGGETVIGKGSVIGGGVWLTRSIPPYTKVLIAEPQLTMKTKGEPD
jgi:serine O-acetyltransferase